MKINTLCTFPCHFQHKKEQRCNQGCNLSFFIVVRFELNAA